MKRTFLLVSSLILVSANVFSQTQTTRETSPKEKISVKSLKQGQVQTVKTASSNTPTSSVSTSETHQEVPSTQNGSNSTVIVPDGLYKDEQVINENN